MCGGFEELSIVTPPPEEAKGSTPLNAQDPTFGKNPNSRPSIRLSELYWKSNWPSRRVAGPKLLVPCWGNTMTRLFPESATNNSVPANAAAAGPGISEFGCGPPFCGPASVMLLG